MNKAGQCWTQLHFMLGFGLPINKRDRAEINHFISENGYLFIILIRVFTFYTAQREISVALNAVVK